MVDKMDSSISFSDTDVRKDPENYGATEVSGYSAKISHDKEGRGALDIAEDELGYDGEGEKPEEYSEKVEKELGGFLEKLAGMGHTSCFYQANKGVNLEVPRHTTMFLCQFDHPKYLQQSQRYTEAEEFISEFEGDERVEELYMDAKKLYQDMISVEGEKIRKEDARYVLPLGTSAKHIHANLNFVSLANMFRELEGEGSKVPGISEEAVEEILEELGEEETALFNREMMDEYNSTGKGYPVTNMFRDTNRALEEMGSPEETVRPFSKKVDVQEPGYRDSFMNLSNFGPEDSEVKGFLTSMSLSAWHQFMRNDTVKQSVQSVYDAADEGEIVIPPSIDGSEYEEEFEELCGRSLELYGELLDEEGEKAVELVPHALSIDVAFSLDYFNLRNGFMKDRNNSSAQWEIREIAQEVDRRVGD